MHNTYSAHKGVSLEAAAVSVSCTGLLQGEDTHLLCRLMTETPARLQTVESCYLENHPFPMPEPAEKPPFISIIIALSNKSVLFIINWAGSFKGGCG